MSYPGDKKTKIKEHIQNKLLYTYEKSNDIMDTNNDPDVYRYNELLQKLIKTTVYMNPLFKFMSKLSLDQNKIFDINFDEIHTDYLMGLRWAPPDAFLTIDANLFHNSDTGVFNKTEFVKSIQYADNDTTAGSSLYIKNKHYIANGLRLYQTDPFTFLTNYVFEDIEKTDTKDGSINIYKALSPYEGYMINENVGSLITYLYSKTQTKTKSKNFTVLKKQQHNFANFLIEKQTIARDMCVDTSGICNGIDINDPHKADSKAITNIVGKNIWVQDNYLYPTNSVTDSFMGDGVLQNLKIQNQFELHEKIHSLSNKPPQNIYDLSKDIDDLLLLPNFTNSEYDNTMLFSSKEYVKESDMGIPENANFKKTHDTIKSKGIPIHLTPLTMAKKMDGNNYTDQDLTRYAQSIKSKSNAKTYYHILTLLDMWKIYQKYCIRYMFYIEIFLIIKKLRGCDKYFRHNVMNHTLSSSNMNGRVMSDLKSFKENYSRLEKFYDFYMNKVITRNTDDSIYDLEENYNKGIYNKNYLFRNGAVNKYLDNWGNQFYKNKENDSIYVSNKKDLEEREANLELLNRKPLIFSYLEPYEPFFNSYSLLYVMSNNDPHTKCYKQMELLIDNENFMKNITNV